MRPLRIGRGTAPRELTLPWQQQTPLLAVGGHMKGTLALSWDRRVVVSPHIGEMDSPRSLAVFEQVAADLQTLYGVRAERIVCDAHPGYTTHRWARRQQALPVEQVWHHQAHASAVAAESGRPGPWLMFTWDGVGLGEDEDAVGRRGAARHAPATGAASRACVRSDCRAANVPGANPGAAPPHCTGSAASHGRTARMPMALPKRPGAITSTVPRPAPPDGCSTRPPH